MISVDQPLLFRATSVSRISPEFVTLQAARLKAALGECDVFVFPSEFIAERYVEWGLPQEKCVVIPNGQTNLGTTFDRSRHSRQVNRFGFFGQFIDNKGVDVIFDALLLLGREQRLPVQGIVVEINGAYGRDQLAERMASVDWVIVPSTWWEIFGLVVSEAWMFGRPVIASAIAGLKERVIPQKNGFTFLPRDGRSLAGLMSNLVGNEQQWIATNRSIEQPWSEDEMLDAHLSLWKEFSPVVYDRQQSQAVAV